MHIIVIIFALNDRRKGGGCSPNYRAPGTTMTYFCLSTPPHNQVTNRELTRGQPTFQYPCLYEPLILLLCTHTYTWLNKACQIKSLTQLNHLAQCLQVPSQQQSLASLPPRLQDQSCQRQHLHHQYIALPPQFLLISVARIQWSPSWRFLIITLSSPWL